jgi:hypothetical protein
MVEAAAYEDLRAELQPSEALLGLSRGRLMGSARPRAANPRALLTPYVNLGLTARRLILQPISARSGRALAGKAPDLPLQEVAAISRADADPLEPGRAVRVVLHTSHGHTLRFRAVGRQAEAADEIVNLWRSLCPETAAAREAPIERCPDCSRELDRPYRFCPYCGSERVPQGSDAS